MAKTIYTERDIVDLAQRGVKEIQVDETVYITDVGREKMQALGMQIKTVRTDAVPTTPASALAGSAHVLGGRRLTEEERRQVIEKVKSGVIARLGPGVDATLLDTLVRRVVGEL